jgi:hypothetical protein
MVFPSRVQRICLTNPPAPLFEFRLPPESFSAVPSRFRRRDVRKPTPLLGFASLQHLQGSGVYLPRVYLARYVPPSGFGYPLDGLLPPSPRRPCFMPTALLGFRPSEHFPPERYPGRFHLGLTRLPFCPPDVPSENPRAGPAVRGSRALTLSGVPRLPDGVSAEHGRILPWASSFPGQSAGCLVRASTRTPPSRFRTCSSADCKPLHPGVSIDTRLARSPPLGPAKQGGQAALLRFPRRSPPAVWVLGDPGYVFTSRPDCHYWPPRAAPWISA